LSAADEPVILMLPFRSLRGFVPVARRWSAMTPVLLVALSTAACGDDPQPVAPTPAPPTLTAVEIEGPAERALGAAGQTLQLRALATLSDGARSDVTNEAAWSVVDARVLSVSSRGLVTGRANGTTSVTATYRDRAGTTRLRVAEELGPRFEVTGIVRDAVRGTPIVGAYILPASVNDEPFNPAVTPLPTVRTDGNGFFTLGTLAGRGRIFVSQFGFEEQTVAVPMLTMPTSLDVRLQPDTAPYIERTLTGRFGAVNEFGRPTTTVRISTRGTGVFDAVLRTGPCPPGEGPLIIAQNGGFGNVSTIAECDYARERFVLRGSEVLLELWGHSTAGTWELTYREPR
jgi:hypothetical protein